MVQERQKKKRRNMFAETRLLMEWVSEHFPGRTWRMQFPVGKDPEVAGVRVETEEERRLIRRRNKKVDMLIEPPPDVVLIESTMWRADETLGQLLGYLLLLPATPEAKEWERYPLSIILLTAQDDAVVKALAEKVGIQYVWWEPPWIDEFLAIYPDRARRAPHGGFAEALVERFGDGLQVTWPGGVSKPRPA